MEQWIKLSIPHLGGTEINYVNEAFREAWVVPLGPNVDEFERRLGEYLGTEHVVALSAGTAAIHLGLVMLGVEHDDEVICQSLTFSASANPIAYQGAKPVFVDSEESTWNMDPALLEIAIRRRIAATGKVPKAIVAVDLYGMPAQMNKIKEVADKYGIPVLEDAAEALGSTLDGKKCGTFGNYGALSFNGNKIITTSGGGALICPTSEAAARVKFLATQARENRPYYYHKTIGYNYRLSNVSAGIGCGQMDFIKDRVARRREIHDMYKNLLSDIEGITVHENPSTAFESNFWLTTMLIDHVTTGITPDELRIKLAEKQIETRLLWRPMHLQPVFEGAPYYGTGVSDRLFEKGLCLPSGSTLTDEQIHTVSDAIHEVIMQ